MDKQVRSTIREEKGSVTIFFVYTIVLIISLVFSVTELARMNAERLYLQMASSVSVDSMLSMYHRKLYEYYHIFGLEIREDEKLLSEYFDFLIPHFRDNVLGTERSINNWEIAHIDKESININHENLLNDNNFENEIIEYMKIALIGKAINFFGEEKNIEDENDLSNIKEMAEELFESYNRKNIYATIHKRYFDFSQSLKNMSKNANEIKKGIKEVNKYLKDAEGLTTTGELASIKKVKNNVEKIKNKVDTIIKAIKGYKEAVNKYIEDVEKTKNKYEEDLKSDKYDFDSDTKDFIENEFETFIDFAIKENEVLHELEELEKNINVDKKEFDEFNIELSSYYTDLTMLDEEKKELARLKGDEKDPVRLEQVNEEIKSIKEETREYVKEIVKPYVKDIEYQEITFYIDASDTREQRAIENILNLGKDMILKKVLTADEYNSLNKGKLSYKKYDVNKNLNIVNKFLINEYRFIDFNYYNKNLTGEVTKSNSNKLETEKMIKGKDSDVENLSEVVNELILIRAAMNILYIYTTPELRERARNLAFVTFGSISPIIQEVMFILIMTCWGTCQSIKDVRKLLHNKKVPFFPNSESFDFNVSDIFSFGEGDISMLNDDDNGKGGLLNMSYKDYLRLLMLKTDGKSMNENMISIIQMNMEEVEETFDINNMLYSFKVTNEFKSTHMLTDMLFLRPKNVVLDESYKIKIEAYSDYGNLKK